LASNISDNDDDDEEEEEEREVINVFSAAAESEDVESLPPPICYGVRVL